MLKTQWWVVKIVRTQDFVYDSDNGRFRIPKYTDRAACERSNKWVHSPHCRDRYEITTATTEEIRRWEREFGQRSSL